MSRQHVAPGSPQRADHRIAVKSFASLTDAERFVAGENPSSNGSVDTVPTKYYAVKSGRNPGIYTDWQSVQEQITGWQKPRHRSFSTRSEAQRFLDEVVPTSPGSLGLPIDFSTLFSSSTAATAAEPSAPKRVKKAAPKAPRVEYDAAKESTYDPGTGPLPSDAEDGFDPNILLDSETGKVVYKTQEQRQAMKSVPGSSSLTEPISIFTDGSSFGNGKAGAYAGVGVYFGPSDQRSVDTRSSS